VVVVRAAGCMVGMAVGLQGGVCFTIAITSSIFLIGP
jgi:hypothetical protein